jgi:hypothetical protein
LLDKTTRKRQWRKIKLALQQNSYDNLLNEIRDINSDLCQLTMQRVRVSVQKPARLSAAKHYNHIRDHAKSLYTVFQERFQCSCKHSHNANLRLQRTAVKNSEEARSKLNVLFDFESTPTTSNTSPSDWYALEFESMDYPQTALKPHNSSDYDSDQSDKKSRHVVPPLSPPEKKYSLRDKFKETFLKPETFLRIG